jgi:hypothetical protein
MTKKLVCDWDHRDEAEVLVREGRKWHLSCEKHVPNFSPNYSVPISQSVLVAEACRNASRVLEALLARKIVQITNDAAPYEGWEYYAALLETADGLRICDIGYCVPAKKFISPLYFVPERFFDSLVKLSLNGWRFEFLDGSVSDEEQLRRFVRNLHRR